MGKGEANVHGQGSRTGPVERYQVHWDGQSLLSCPGGQSQKSQPSSKPAWGGTEEPKAFADHGHNHHSY